MDSESSSQNRVLVAVSEELREAINSILLNESFTPITTLSPDSLKTIIFQQNIQALIIESTWCLGEENGINLFELTSGKIPTVTLINKGTLEKYGPERTYGQLYYPTELQDFCTIPFTIDEFTLRLHKVIAKTKK